MSFRHLGLSETLLSTLSSLSYHKPTPIQRLVIPQVLMGRDVIACAQTGTGKTASFTLPIIDILHEQSAKVRMPKALILTPTRELAQQIASDVDKQAHKHAVSYAQLTGGTLMAAQEKQLKKPNHLLIATPGRLMDMAERGHVLMIGITICVIDEADMMMDMGFLKDIEKILQMLPKQRQTLLFSATMPQDIRRLATSFLHEPKELSAAPPSSATANVEHVLSLVQPRDKLSTLLTTIQQENIHSAIIFCNRKKDIDALVSQLQKQNTGATAIHGDIDQNKRYDILARFRQGQIKILVASNVMARGIDVQNLSHVINYDVPFAAEDYIHRSGRTGRAGERGRSITLATPQENTLLTAIEKLLVINTLEFQLLSSPLSLSRAQFQRYADETAEGQPARPASRAPAPAQRKQTAQLTREGGAGKGSARRRGKGKYDGRQQREGRTSQQGQPVSQRGAQQARGKSDSTDATATASTGHLPSFLTRKIPVIPS
ncbi:MAG: DEAD/DEAH box helicase [Alphaproteobacteria bacterium GM202ARS2]|nr:DEAD/DEAH box helicase [Alphaproteobacteria bacterium GM202ARS2]